MFFLSWRQLMSRKKQSILILLGISFGTMLYVAISGLQLGMRQYISDQLLSNTSHILIQGPERRIKAQEVKAALHPNEFIAWTSPPSGLRAESQLTNYGGWYRFLANDPQVLDFSPRLTGHAMLVSGKFSTSVNLVGVIPAKQVRVSRIESYMTEGSMLDLQGGNKIVIGSGVAEDLGVRLGEVISVIVGNYSMVPLKLVGILEMGNKQVDRSMALTNLPTMQTLSRSPGRVNEIGVVLYDVDLAEQVAANWKLLTRDKVEDWKEANQQFMEMIRVQDFVRYFIMVAILIVASFGVYNVLSIMINQKKREIAILRAIGYGPKRILQLVFYQGILLGISGGALGLLFGHLLCVAVESIKLNISIGGSNHLLVSYDPQTYGVAFIAAIVSSMMAAYIPARAASAMVPMEIIRSGL